MLRVQPSMIPLRTLMELPHIENQEFIVLESQVKIVQEMIDEIIFTTFQKSQSFLIIILKKFIFDILNHKLSLPSLQDILLRVKQYESDITLYKEHFFHIQKLMLFQYTHSLSFNKNQDQQFTQHQTQIICKNVNQATDFSEVNKYQQVLTWNPTPDTLQQITAQEEAIDFSSPLIDKDLTSLSIDREFESQVSQKMYESICNQKYFLSQHLTTSEDDKQTKKSNIIKQFKRKIQTKLKIQPCVSRFTLELTKNPVENQKELLDWKRSKHSILQQNSLQKALCPDDYQEMKIIQKMKQNYYQQKIRSALLKRKLTSKHLFT